MKLSADLYLLTCNRLPARINVEQTAVLLGFAEHDIPILVCAKLLKPLGDPAPNAPKYFAASEILDHAQDHKWLGKATKATAKHWKLKRAKLHAKQTEETLTCPI